MAAMDFPSSPTNGQIANGYTYDSAKGAWRKNAAVTVSVTTSAVAPSNPNPGDQWLYTNEGTLFTWWSDGTSSQWVQSSSVIANADPNPMPAGSIMAWGGATAPQNWLLCDGSAVSRSTYASLFAAIGTQYGTGDGSTTFNLPNLKGRTIVGLDSTQTEFDALGETGGAKTHTLTSSEIPSHTHSFSATTSTTGSHNHINGWASITGYNYVGSGGNSTWPFGGGSNAAQRDLQAAGDHAHTVSGTTGAAGTGGAHNNLQPYIVLNYIIKASAGVTPGDSVLTTRVGALETAVRSVALGGTGASTLASGSYLKGAGTGAITAQAGIPASDITSGALGIAYGGTGATTGAGLVKVVPTSITNSAGTASLDSTTGEVTFTNVTSIGLNGIFTSGYRSYRIVYAVTGAFTQTQMYRFRTGGTDNSSASYYFQEIYAGTTTIGASGWNNQTTGRIGYSQATYRATHVFDVVNPQAVEPTELLCNFGRVQGPTICQVIGGFNATTQFDGMNFYLGSGTGGSSGTLNVYGYR